METKVSAKILKITFINLDILSLNKAHNILKMEAETKEFLRQMINRPFTQEHLWVGSFYELPIMYFYDNITDIDTMALRTNVLVSKSKQDDEQEPRNTSENMSQVSIRSLQSVDFETYFSKTREFWPQKRELRIDSRKSHVGFTRLIDVNEGRPFRRNDVRFDTDDGASRKCNLIPKSELEQMCLKVFGDMNLGMSLENTKRADILTKFSLEPTLGDSSLFTNLLSAFEDFQMDWVDCIYCPFWPDEAKDWIHRKRQYGWPTSCMIDTIVNDGCFILSKPHQNHTGDEEFRFSFSWAELKLIHSWNNVQKHIYHILRLIKKNIEKKCDGKDKCHLTTYHFKTLMFWSCENRPPEFWDEENIENSLKTLLCTLIEWMNNKDCPNYFIPDNNMWDYLPDDWNFEEEMKEIVWTIENIEEYIGKKAGMFDYLKDRRDNKIHLSLPNKLLFILQMRFYHAHILNPSLPGRQKYTVANAINESDYICSKIKSLYEAVIRHSFVATEKPSSNSNKELVEEILSNLRKCREVSFEGFTTLAFSACGNGHELMQKILETPIGQYQQKSENQCKQCTKDDILMLKVLPAFQSWCEYINYVIDHPFLILSYAYEANFHYTGFVDCPDFKDHCRQAFELSEQGLDLCMELQSKPTFWISVIPELLPLILTKKWLNIFDRHIAAALKSYFSSDEEFDNTNFVIHFSPQHFLKYVRVQCMRILGCSFDEESEIINVMNNMDTNPNTNILRKALIDSKL